VTSGTGFLLLRPDYECVGDNGLWKDCEPKEFCSFKTWQKTREFRIKQGSDDYIENWIFQLNLHCTPESTTDRLFVTFLVGQMCGQLFLAWMSDRYGRKIYYVSSVCAQLPFLQVVLFSNSLILTFVMYFSLGLCFVGRYYGSFVNIVEYTPNKYKRTIASALLVVDVTHTICIITYFKYVRNVVYLEIFGICLNIVAIVCVLWIPESPVYLYNMFRFDECREVLNRVAKVNRIPKERLEEYKNFYFDTEGDQKKC
jgi:Sugar (and other) transporter